MDFGYFADTNFREFLDFRYFASPNLREKKDKKDENDTELTLMQRVTAFASIVKPIKRRFF